MRSRYLQISLLLAAMTPVVMFAATDAQDVDALVAGASPSVGKTMSAQCVACHTVEKGEGPRVGPNLWNVVGRPIATTEGFAFSEALAEKTGDWTNAMLDAFLASPSGFAPGTRMVLPGIEDPAARASIIRYLHSLSDQPVEFTDAPSASSVAVADPFGDSWPEGEGREITGYTCDACHSLAIVRQQGLSRDSWDELLDWMVEEQGMDEPDADNREKILGYLSEHFNIDN